MKNKRIILGVTGSIAAYKAIELTRRLTEAGSLVDIILTDAAKRFVTPLSFVSITKGNVYTDLFEAPLSHIKIAEEASLMVIAPATANIIGKMASGIADDMLTTTYMAYKRTVIVAPAMNWRMYENPVLQRNLETLCSLGVIQVGPERGALACGDSHIGRMADISDIVEEVRSALTRKDLKGRRIVITAGPTREYIDPVRFISNRSSGKMGFSIARVAVQRGAEVTLISGPVNLKPPRGVFLINVETASEMRDAVLSHVKGADVLIMSAAVADFSPQYKSEKKIESREGLNLTLKRTPDILYEISHLKDRPLIVGFSAETGANIERARQKLLEKGADIIVFNDVTEPGAGFDVDTNKVTIIERDREIPLPLMKKEEVAESLISRVAEILIKDTRQD